MKIFRRSYIFQTKWTAPKWPTWLWQQRVWILMLWYFRFSFLINFAKKSKILGLAWPREVLSGESPLSTSRGQAKKNFHRLFGCYTAGSPFLTYSSLFFFVTAKAQFVLIVVIVFISHRSYHNVKMDYSLIGNCIWVFLVTFRKRTSALQTQMFLNWRELRVSL